MLKSKFHDCKERIILVFIFFLLFIFLNCIIIYTSQFNLDFNSKTPENKLSNSLNSDFDILKFWETEIKRVENTSLNIAFGDNNTIEHVNSETKEIETYTVKEVFFDSPNWVGSNKTKIRIHGYFLYPEVIKTPQPGCLYMHGLGESADNGFQLAYQYLELGFIFLCYSHPGHGQSEGAKPSPQNFYYQGNYNQTSHYYLTLCAAIQGLRVLEKNSMVNKSQIFTSGFSYGGLNAMWLSSICGDRIAGTIPIASAGNNKIMLKYPQKLLFWIWNKNPKKIPESWWQNQNLRIDPVYYLRSDNLPPILWQIGTNDEFFHYESITKTYKMANTSLKYLQIHPNAHHQYLQCSNTIKSFITNILNDSVKKNLPNTTINEENPKLTLIGNALSVKISLNSKLSVEKVQICYKYINLLGEYWKIVDLSRDKEGNWVGSVPTPMMTSEVNYFVIVRMNENGNWFTSQIFNGGILSNNSSVMMIFLILLSFIIPISRIVYNQYKNINKKINPNNYVREKSFFFIKITIIVFLEGLLIYSFSQPLLIFGENAVEWSIFFIFDQLLAYNPLFSIFTTLIPILLISSFFILIIKSFKNTRSAAFFKLIYFIGIFLVFLILSINLAISPVTKEFQPVNLGSGFYLIFVNFICLYLIGLSSKEFHMRLNIRS